jgi:hypothetical protein
MIVIGWFLAAIVTAARRWMRVVYFNESFLRWHLREGLVQSL